MFEGLIQKQRDYVISGKTKPIKDRIDSLKCLKKTIQTYETAIFDALHKDLGKAPFEAYVTEVGFVLSSISDFIKHIKKWTQDKHVKTPIHQPFAKSFIRLEPYGIVLIIGPFNYPFQLVLEPLIGALAAGNTVILKPSEFAKHTEAIIQTIIQETFTEEQVAVVTGSVQETQALVRSDVNYIFFTGSVPVGKKIMQAVAEKLIPVTLELGGKSPTIVHKDAKLPIAAKRIIWGKFINAGQTCIAPDYLYIHKSIAEPFYHELQTVLHDFYGENPKTHSDYGSIINEKHFDRLLTLMDPQKTFVGGESDKTCLYIAPTLMKDVHWNDPVMHDEIFGPILPILTYDSTEAMIQEILSRPNPLALYIFSENATFQKQVMDSISFGGGCINDTISHVASPHLPFGGVGNSGMGYYHGKYSIETFSHKKSMMKKPSWFESGLAFPPYSGGNNSGNKNKKANKDKLKTIRKFMK